MWILILLVVILASQNRNSQQQMAGTASVSWNVPLNDWGSNVGIFGYPGWGTGLAGQPGVTPPGAISFL